MNVEQGKEALKQQIMLYVCITSRNVIIARSKSRHGGPTELSLSLHFGLI